MKPNKSLLKFIFMHLSLMVVFTSTITFLFFQFVLPVMTHHGEAIAVPSLAGISLEEADVLLRQRKLRFSITEETTYLPEYPPMTVLEQHPKSGTSVKSGRKIYLTLNSRTPPQVEIPNLVDGSVRNAKALLTDKGLLLGKIKYVPDIAQNAVLEQKYQGKVIAPGTLIYKGSKIDLIVGKGLGKRSVEVPTLVGMKLEEAELLLLDKGINVGNISYSTDNTQGIPGTIFQQMPAAGGQVRVGEAVDLWLVERPYEEGEDSRASMLPGN